LRRGVKKAEVPYFTRLRCADRLGWAVIRLCARLKKNSFA
jgi:hypothetical protein